MGRDQSHAIDCHRAFAMNVTPHPTRPACRRASPDFAPTRAPSPRPEVPISLTELVSHRPYLVRFAMKKLRDPVLAEDAVHDVLEAVLCGRAVFSGRAALRSWLTAVLKNKIVDALRRVEHHEALDDDASDGAGHAVACPQPRPDEVAEQRQALARALDGIERLPATLRDAMRLRVIEERSTASVCAELGISEENLFVRVHRARKQLLS
jgi:RNA polymerase sigma-70 factor, ECF subfamily